MSRRSRSREDEDALELFLDAMSNMFGGVVFIAVAVVVLLQFTVRPSPTTADGLDEAPIDEATPRIAAVRAEIEALEGVLAAAGGAVDPSSETRPERVRYDTLLASREAARAEVEHLEAEAARRRVELENVRRVNEAAQLDQEQSQSALAQARAALEEARRRPPQRLRVPRFQQTTKQEFPVLLRAGRLVTVFRAGPGGVTTQLNRAALFIDPEDQTVRGKDRAGLTLGGGAEARALLLERLKPLDPARHYVAIAVWPDSFDEAALLRDTLIDLGFEYGLNFVPKGQGVPFKAASGVQ